MRKLPEDFDGIVTYRADYMHTATFKTLKVSLKRALLALFGLACLLLGLISTMVGLLLMFVKVARLGTPSNILLMTIWIFLCCEIFIAFGVTTILVGLRYIFNRSDWWASIVHRYWHKAMRCAMILPAVAIGLGFVVWLLGLLF